MLAVERSDGVRHGREDDRERPDRSGPAALRVHADENADADDPNGDPDRAPAGDALVRRIEAFPIAAIPESIRVWPHAISQNGSAVVITPSTTPGQPNWRRQRTACRGPRLATSTAPSASAAKSSLPVIVAAGERSRRAISMNMNDDPQIAATASGVSPAGASSAHAG